MFSRLLPKESNFFDLFDKQVGYVVDAAVHFKAFVSKGGLDESALRKMKDIEHHGDDVTREIIDRLDKTFITPFDREDIHALAKEMDDIIDMIHTIINRLKVYSLKSADRNLIEFASAIENSALALTGAVKGMRNKKNNREVLKCCEEVSRLENVGDAMRDRMLADLFEESKNDPIFVIKWKEIYQDAETVLDICEDVAHIVESILVKNA